MAHEALVSVRSGACLPPSEVHTVIVRRSACPASSEVHADFVRKRACPSSSEVHADIARRKGCVQSFLLRSTQRRRRCTRGSCEEEGKRAIPLPPRKPRSTQRKTLDLEGGEPVSPPPGKHTTNAQPMQTSRTVSICATSATRQKETEKFSTKQRLVFELENESSSCLCSSFSSQICSNANFNAVGFFFFRRRLAICQSHMT